MLTFMQVALFEVIVRAHSGEQAFDQPQITGQIFGMNATPPPRRGVRDSEGGLSICLAAVLTTAAAFGYDLGRAVAVGTSLSSRVRLAPRTDPSVRNYRTGLLPWVLARNRSSGKSCRRRGRGSHRSPIVRILCQVRLWRWLRRRSVRSGLFFGGRAPCRFLTSDNAH